MNRFLSICTGEQTLGDVMIPVRDILMLVVSLSAIMAGILFPGPAAVFQPYPIYSMMVLLFFSFLSMRIGTVMNILKGSVLHIGYFVFLKLILLPLLAFLLFRTLLPDYALAAMLLSGVSCGVASPFFAGMVNANVFLVLGMVVISSALVPFTLPFMVKILAGRELEISFFDMSRLLCLVIFIPLLLAELFNRFTPQIVLKLSRVKYAVSLGTFVVTNLGIFSRYSEFLRGEPSSVAAALGVSFLIAGISFAAGILFSYGRPVEDHLSLIISFGVMNNVLVIVFSSQFFGPIEPTVAALYTIPFFGLIVPLRLYRSWGSRRRHPVD